MSSLRRALPAGIVDAGFASLATFAAGLYAADQLSTRELGVYAIFFSAFLTSAVVAIQLIGSPALVEAVREDVSLRLLLLPKALRLAFLPSVIATVMIAAAAFVTWNQADRAVVVWFLLSALPVTILSPLQDIVRRFFHMAQRSWRAAAMSVIQFVAMALAIVGAHVLDIPVAAVPFGALTIANIASLSFGLWARSADASGQVAPRELRFRDLARGGRWLLARALLPTAGGFLSATLVSFLASTTAVGHAEAARIAAQPILVLAFGLSAVVNPRSMEAATRLDRSGATSAFRLNAAILGAASVGYLAVAAIDWPWNPMATILPKAYEVGGLVVVSVLAHLAVGIFYPRGAEFMAARREPTLLAIEAVASPVQIAIALTAALTGAFARPLGHLAMATTRIWLSIRHRRRLYPATKQDKSHA